MYNHYHLLWQWYDLKREERRLCLQLHQRGDTWQDLEKRQDKLAEHQAEVEDFEKFNRRALNLRQHEK